MSNYTSISLPISLHKELTLLKEQRGKSIGTISSEIIAMAGQIVKKHIQSISGEDFKLEEYEQNIMRNLLRYRNTAKFREVSEEATRSVAVSKPEAEMLKQARGIFSLTNGQFFEVMIPIYEKSYFNIGFDDKVIALAGQVQRIAKAKSNEAKTFLDVYNYSIICNHINSLITADMDEGERNNILDMMPANPWNDIVDKKPTKQDFM